MINFGESTYCNLKRWITYYYQIDSVHQVCKKGDSVLVIGSGDYIVTKVLKHSFKLNVETLDRFEDATYVLDLKSLCMDSIPEYKCIVCCQVLEHLPIEYFERIITILANKCDRLVLSFPIYEKKINSISHCWELGYGNDTDNILTILSNFGKVETFIVEENKQFFILDKNE